MIYERFRENYDGKKGNILNIYGYFKRNFIIIICVYDMCWAWNHELQKNEKLHFKDMAIINNNSL